MNKKTSLFIIITVAAVAGIVVAYSLIKSNSELLKSKCRLYFFNEVGTSMNFEEREIKYRTTRDFPDAVVEELLRGPENRKYKRIVDRRTELLSIDYYSADSLLVNFSSEYLTGDDAKDSLTTYAVVKTLCDLPEINSVKVVVEGCEIVTSDGSAIGYLTADDINLPTDTNTSETREIALYFQSKDTGKLKKEIRSVKITDQQPIEQYIINELIKGPEDESNSDVLSKDTVLTSVETSYNVCFVNFESSFIDKNSGSDDKQMMAIYSIVNSLTELKNITKVQFLMDGKKVNGFGNIDLGELFFRNSDIIE